MIKMPHAQYPESRVALVIGNNNYRNLQRLKNAVADAQAIEAVLMTSGFRVESGVNLDHNAMTTMFVNFVQDLRNNGGFGLFWFSGHGVQYSSKNYLLPVDINDITEQRELDLLVHRSICLNTILDQLANTSAKLILVIDTCRNSPIRAVDRGNGLLLANDSSTPKNFMIIYAAGHNEEALDGLPGDDTHANGLFTRELLPLLAKPGMTIHAAVQSAIESVQAKAASVHLPQNAVSGFRQNPAIYYQGNVELVLRPKDLSEQHPPPYSGKEETKKARTGHGPSTAATLLALPFAPETERRSPWPENLLMRIGVDRTQLVGVVTGIEGEILHDALRYTEALIIQSDLGGRFGRRRWSRVGPEEPLPEKLDQPFGLIWPVYGELTVSQIDEAIHTCLTCADGPQDSGRGSAGNVVIFTLATDEESQARECLRLMLERSVKLKIDINICGWMAERASAAAELVNGGCTDGIELGPALLPLEWELVRNGHDAQSVPSRSRAIAVLRNMRGKLSRDLHPLCDWTCGDITDSEFLARAKSRACQLASFAGLLTGAGNHPSPTEAARGAAVVAAAATNRELAIILAGLPVCSPVLKALVDSPGAVRATVGLVTKDEVLSVAPPWLGQLVDRSRGKRQLIL